MMLKHLKSLGQRTDTFCKLKEWIEDNIDTLYNDDHLKKVFLKDKSIG